MLCTTTNALQTLSTENAESSTPEQKHGSDTLKALYCSNVLLDDKMLLVFRVMQWGFIDWLRYLICNGNWSNINLNVHFLLVCMFKAGTMLLSLWLLCFIISYIQLTLRCINCLHTIMNNSNMRKADMFYTNKSYYFKIIFLSVLLTLNPSNASEKKRKRFLSCCQKVNK